MCKFSRRSAVGCSDWLDVIIVRVVVEVSKTDSPCRAVGELECQKKVSVFRIKIGKRNLLLRPREWIIAVHVLKVQNVKNGLAIVGGVAHSEGFGEQGECPGVWPRRLSQHAADEHRETSAPHEAPKAAAEAQRVWLRDGSRSGPSQFATVSDRPKPMQKTGENPVCVAMTSNEKEVSYRHRGRAVLGVQEF